MQIPVPAATSTTERSQELEFDVEWLAVLRRTHNLLQTHRGVVQLPQQVDKITAQVCEWFTSIVHFAPVLCGEYVTFGEQLIHCFGEKRPYIVLLVIVFR